MIEQDQEAVEKYKVVAGEETKPVIVITGTVEEYERFCMATGRNKETAIAVRQGFQIGFYPNVPITHYGTFWLNAAYDSLEYKERVRNIVLANRIL